MNLALMFVAKQMGTISSDREILILISLNRNRNSIGNENGNEIYM